VVATAAIGMIDGVKPEQCRTPDIVADAAHAILIRPSRDYTGHFAIDDEVLRDEGITDFDRYAVKPGTPLLPDFFLD
jgi:citronellol/citronellal dehydrogenase